MAPVTFTVNVSSLGSTWVPSAFLADGAQAPTLTPQGSTMLPEVQTYIDAYRAAELTHEQAVAALYREHQPRRLDLREKRHQLRLDDPQFYEQIRQVDQEIYELEQDYYQRQDRLGDELRAAHRAATAALQQSSDPVVAWIALNALDSYHHEALTALKALPLTLTQLDDLARRESWCHVYQTMRTKMIADGIFREPFLIERRSSKKSSWRSTFKQEWTIPGTSHRITRDGLIRAYHQGIAAVTFTGTDGREVYFRITEQSTEPTSA